MKKHLCIAILGPDGSGKSSTINGIKTNLQDLGFSVTIFHLMPFKISNRNKQTVSDPHGKPNRTVVLSISKLFYFLLAYQIGFLLKISPNKDNKKIFIFDRYYNDLIIDPKRYRYGGPIWVAQLIEKFIPKPDMIILLDAPAEILQARKQEVSFKETSRQREAYLQYVKRLKNGVIIDASQPLKQVVYSTTRAIANNLSQKAGSP